MKTYAVSRFLLSGRFRRPGVITMAICWPKPL